MSIDIDPWTLHRVDGSHHNVGRIFLPTHHDARLWHHKSINKINTQLTRVETRHELVEHHPLGKANVVLQLREQSHCSNGRHVFKHALFPLLGHTSCGATLDEKGIFDTGTFLWVGEQRQDIVAIARDARLELGTLVPGGRQHHMRCYIKIVLIFNFIDFALRPIGRTHNCKFQRVDIVIQFIGRTMHSQPQIEPFFSCFGKFGIEFFKLAQQCHIACREGVIGSCQALLHLAETIEHIARHIKGKHGS